MVLHLGSTLEERLDNLAAQTQRSPEQLAQEGVETFLDYEECTMGVVNRARKDIADGRVVNHEEVVLQFAKLTNHS